MASKILETISNFGMEISYNSLPYIDHSPVGIKNWGVTNLLYNRRQRIDFTILNCDKTSFWGWKLKSKDLKYSFWFGTLKKARLRFIG